MAKKNVRNMKVCGQSGYKYETVPAITLKGKWLEDEEMPDPSEYIQSRNGVDFIPSSMMLSAVDRKLRMEMGSEKMLTGILELLRGMMR